ncbi:MAG TPA: S8 family serine peptidase, partial [Burkholderiaceae bacterium]|nr:S8 family serine peptidase [Burkholderiaceae bacterium]
MNTHQHSIVGIKSAIGFLARWVRGRGWVLLLVLCLSPEVAQAQLRLPSVNLPATPRINTINANNLRGNIEPLLNTAVDDAVSLTDLRLAHTTELLRAHRDVLESDQHGEPVIRHEILVWSPDSAARAAVLTAGLVIASEYPLDGLDQTLMVLRVPDDMKTADALTHLRALDHDAYFDFNHVYTGSSSMPTDEVTPALDAPVPEANKNIAVGLIDGGVDSKHVVFKNANLRRWGCNGREHASEHGTAVAALMVGRSEPFHGVAPHGTLFAADIYCDNPKGGSAADIAQALGWMAHEKVGVINLSLVGPPNQLLERVVNLMIQRGHLLVAAVGNDGPAAPPLYPASYPGVVGVSAVDARRHPLPEAARGPQVMFAAPGSNMVTAALGAPPYRQVRGTSFAAPIVATMLASYLPHPDKDAAKIAMLALAQLASGNNQPILGDEFGYGIVGEAYRIDPMRLR